MKWLAPVVVFVLSVPVSRAGPWQTFEKCALVEKEYFDGDSFHVATQKPDAKKRHTYIFRLYGVDCPETDTRIPKRLAEQEREFRVAGKELLEWGEKAKAFTRRFLSKPFTVHTSKEDAGGDSKEKRYYAVVVGSGGKRLDEALLEAGLARAYGMGADWPKGVTAKEFLRKLHPLQSAAQRARAGVWRNK